MTEREKRNLAAEITDKALDLEAGPEREGYIQKRCGGDLQLMRYVHEYIAAGLKESSEPQDRFPVKRIGSYRLDEELGRGSMGIVYRAFDAAIGRTVAVKIILSQRFSTGEEDAEMKLRFTREAAAAGKLSHSHIIVIYQLGEENGIRYMAMEFVPGVSLERMLKDSVPMELQRALSILSQIADALDFAHAEGVVHRDIKPANIMVRPDGRIKIADFGIARIVSQTMTKIGDHMGTPAYMAPEQILASKVDGKADQFSLSVMAYQMLSGKKPFTADTGHAVMYKITNLDPPALNEVNVLLPSTCAAVVHRALAKKPDERYPSCTAFIQALRKSLIEQPEPVIRTNDVPGATKKSPPRSDELPRAGGWDRHSRNPTNTSSQSKVADPKIPGKYDVPPAYKLNFNDFDFNQLKALRADVASGPNGRWSRSATRKWIVSSALVITAGSLLAFYLTTRPQDNQQKKTTAPIETQNELSRLQPRGLPETNAKDESPKSKKITVLPKNAGKKKSMSSPEPAPRTMVSAWDAPPKNAGKKKSTSSPEPAPRTMVSAWDAPPHPITELIVHSQINASVSVRLNNGPLVELGGGGTTRLDLTSGQNVLSLWSCGWPAPECRWLPYGVHSAETWLVVASSPAPRAILTRQ